MAKVDIKTTTFNNIKRIEYGIINTTCIECLHNIYHTHIIWHDIYHTHNMWHSTLHGRLNSIIGPGQSSALVLITTQPLTGIKISIKLNI